MIRDIAKQRILYVDLTKSKTWTEDVDDKLVRQYIGGRGMAAYLLYRMVPKGTDSLGADNVMIFSSGVLNGTSAPCSGRSTVTCKSPATGLYLKTSVGSHWSSELVYAGYDYIVVKGAAAEPSYLLVTNETVEIRPAGHLWGLGTREADALIKSEVGDPETQIAQIGPAGENKVAFACIIYGMYNAAGRGGAGTVMGSKNLKAIAVRGKGGLKPSQAKEFFDLSLKIQQELCQDPGSMGLREFGTAGFVPMLNQATMLPCNNFTEPSIEGAEQLSGQQLVDGGHLVSRKSCYACPIACHRYVKSVKHDFGEFLDSGPELEAAMSLGSEVGVVDTEAMLKANLMCNDYGMDVISAGHVIAWAMESSEKGVITGEKKTDGLNLQFGNSETLLELLKLISLREGFLGNLLADGVKKAAAEVGGGSEKWAVQAKGLEMSAADTRLLKGYALAFALNPRGPDHLTTQCLAELGVSPEAVALVTKITGDAKYAAPHLLDKRAEIVSWHEECYAATDALGFCTFTSTSAYNVSPERMASLFGMATGIKISEEDLMTAGRRIVTLERCFNTREGLTRKDDTLPHRMMNDSVSTGAFTGAVTSQEDLEKMLNDYYTLNGWDVETGLPTTETLEKLGLLSLVGK